MESVTENVIWDIPGYRRIEGKAAFRKALEEMVPSPPVKLSIDKIITHGREASVNGVISAIPKGQSKMSTIAFCDVYKLSGFKNPRISEMISYTVELKD